jgi:pSer/pThr/pTyr-binding forkhead associated (FHA) protein
MQASLVMFKADGERRDFPLHKQTTVVGRKNTCDLRIPLSSVSRQHFQIEQGDDALVLRDLGSSNGTYYNDERTMETELAPGDRVRVGPVTFVVVIDGEPKQIVPITTVLPEETGEIQTRPAPEPQPAAAAATPAADDDDDEDISVDEIMAGVEEESHTPTVDLDEEDPIAALEALASTEEDDDAASPPRLDEDQDETK